MLLVLPSTLALFSSSIYPTTIILNGPNSSALNTSEADALYIQLNGANQNLITSSFDYGIYGINATRLCDLTGCIPTEVWERVSGNVKLKNIINRLEVNTEKFTINSTGTVRIQTKDSGIATANLFIETGDSSTSTTGQIIIQTGTTSSGSFQEAEITLNPQGGTLLSSFTGVDIGNPAILGVVEKTALSVEGSIFTGTRYYLSQNQFINDDATNRMGLSVRNSGGAGTIRFINDVGSIQISLQNDVTSTQVLALRQTETENIDTIYNAGFNQRFFKNAATGETKRLEVFGFTNNGDDRTKLTLTTKDALVGGLSQVVGVVHSNDTLFLSSNNNKVWLNDTLRILPSDRARQCSTNETGEIIYNLTAKHLSFCDSIQWVAIK